MTTAVRPVTYAEFLEMPDPDSGRLELLGGEVVLMPGGSGTHGVVIWKVAKHLTDFITRHQLGSLISSANFHVQSDPDWAPVPDLAFVSNDRIAAIFRSDKPFEGSPDLAIEVISSSNKVSEITRKTQAYFAGGALRVWIVEPQSATVTVHRNDRTARVLVPGDTLNSDDAAFATPGLVLSVSELFV